MAEGSVKGKSKVNVTNFVGSRFHGSAANLREALKFSPPGTVYKGTHLGTGQAVIGFHTIRKRHNKALPAVIGVRFV